MTDHLTENQISRWVIGGSTTDEQNHVQTCRKCTAEVDKFSETLSLFRSVIRNQAEYRTAVGTEQALSTIHERSEQTAVVLHFVETPSLLGSLKRAVVDTLYPPKIET